MTKGSAKTLLERAVILDSETLGLSRGSGIHQIATYTYASNKVQSWTLDPSIVVVKSAQAQDITKLASSAFDQHRLVEFETWKQSLEALINIDLKRDLRHQLTQEEFHSHVEKLFPLLRGTFLNQQGAQYGNLLNRVWSPDEVLAQMGIGETAPEIERTMAQVLSPGSSFNQAIQGKTIWGANVNFEAKQFGAYVAATGNEAIKHTMETFTDSPDPFYVTGVEINRAKVLAAKTGDFTEVWKAYLAHPGRPGETQVRDILDVARAYRGYGRQLGLTDVQSSYFGTSMDTMFKLFGSTEQDPKLAAEYIQAKQAHTATRDVGFTEKYVLEKLIHHTEALQHVKEGTPYGKHLLAEAEQKRGLLYQSAQYFAREELVGKEISTRLTLQQIQRAHQSIAREGSVLVTTGVGSIWETVVETPSQGQQSMLRSGSAKESFTSVEELIGHFESIGRNQEFGTSPRDIWTQLQGGLAAADDKEHFLTQAVEWARGAEEQVFKSKTEEILSTVSRRTRGPWVNSLAEEAIQGIGHLTPASKGVLGLGALAIAATAGYFYAKGGDYQRGQRPNGSMVSYSYQDWAAAQDARQATYIEGMGEQGVAGQTRKQNTDFGSPYQGPWTSSQVLINQELLADREKWLREQYGAVHSTEDYGLFSAFGAFKELSLQRQGYSFVSEGVPVNAASYGMKGNLVGIDLTKGNWKVSADDADTILIKRGGIRGAISSFFGQNQGYSFRLAGIDSPEVAHANEGFHAPQPHGEESAIIFQRMLADSKSLQLVFDPKQTTYGRALGAVIADGKNLNYELVKQGQAAFLPFGKSENAIIDYGPLKAMEARAHGANQGMWQTPWAQAFYDISQESRNRITFNTFTKPERIVESGAKLSALSLMEQAQAQGRYTEANAQAASEIGKQLDQNRLKPDYNNGPEMFHPPRVAHESYIPELMADQIGFMKTHGTGEGQNKFSRRNGYGNLDKAMVLDSLGTTNTVWRHKSSQAFEMYDTRSTMAQERKARMAENQRAVNQTVFNSGIGHYLM